MRSQFTEQLTLHELAATACMSPFHFQRRFKEYFGRSPSQFITGLRLEKACQLLKTTNIPITDAAHQCGYSSTPSFNNLFKKKLGCTPGHYRQAK